MTAPTAATRLPIRMTTPLVAVGYGETANCRWHEETRGGEVAVVYKPAPRPVMCVGVRAMRGGTLFFDGSQLLGGWGIGHVLFGGLHAKIRRREVLRIHVCTCMYASYCIAYGLMIHVSIFSSINCLCFPWWKQNRLYRNIKMYVRWFVDRWSIPGLAVGSDNLWLLVRSDGPTYIMYMYTCTYRNLAYPSISRVRLYMSILKSSHSTCLNMHPETSFAKKPKQVSGHKWKIHVTEVDHECRYFIIHLRTQLNYCPDVVQRQR